MCIRMCQDVESLREWPCLCGVCKRALGCFDILNVFTQTSQVYVYVRLTNVTDLLLWLMCSLWLLSLPYFFIGSSFGPTFEVCVPVLRPSPILRN